MKLETLLNSMFYREVSVGWDSANYLEKKFPYNNSCKFELQVS